MTLAAGRSHVQPQPHRGNDQTDSGGSNPARSSAPPNAPNPLIWPPDTPNRR